MIYVDTREKKWDHIKAYFEKNDIEYEMHKLDVGDYMISGQNRLTIDRKQNMQEMYQCLVADRGRFGREVMRAYQHGQKLIVLIEHGGKIHSIDDVSSWKPKYGTVPSSEIAKRMVRLHIAFGVEFLFCSKRSTGSRIADILNNSVTFLQNGGTK